MADTVDVLQNVGTSPKRKTLAILGDGFAAGSDQDIYKKYVRDVVMRVFASDYFNEDAAAWNIRRINLESVDSGVSTRKWDCTERRTTCQTTRTKTTSATPR